MRLLPVLAVMLVITYVEAAPRPRVTAGEPVAMHPAQYRTVGSVADIVAYIPINVLNKKKKGGDGDHCGDKGGDKGDGDKGGDKGDGDKGGDKGDGEKCGGKGDGDKCGGKGDGDKGGDKGGGACGIKKTLINAVIIAPIDILPLS